jgi:hypothetical protein
MMGAPRGLEWDSRGRARIVGDEGQSRKPRVTLERKITWSATTEGLYSWQSGEGRDTPIGWDTSRIGSDEMPPLYENRCLAVGLVQMRLRQSLAEC